MAKIMSAQSILKQKGFVQNKFDTSGFMNAVGQYFMENNVEDRLLLVPFRFLDIERQTTDSGVEYNVFNPFRVARNEEKVGYKVQTDKDEKGYFKFIQELFKSDFDEYIYEREAGLLAPRIIVDKPFFENAAGLLRVMGGYVVEKQVKKKRKLYWVTLV